MAHITNKQYVPPVYATEAQPSTSTVPNMTLQEIGQCEEMDRQVRIRTGESVAREIHSLKEAFKNIQTSKGHKGLEYEDLCMHPDIELPVGYKMPKFDLFDGKGNPYSHLRSYCDKLIGVGKNQAIIMKLFVRSLTGEALDWYTSQDPQKWHNWGTMAQDFVDRFRFNTDTVLDRFYLMKLEKKSTETFREYAMKWRAEAAKVQPPIEESRMMKLSIVRTTRESLDTTLKIAMPSETIEALIKEGVIQLKGPSSNVNDNPLPDHDNANVNMITVDEEHNLEGTIVSVRRKEKVKSSAFVTPMITVQLRAPFGVEVLHPKSRVMSPSFLGKALSTNLRRKRYALLPKPVPPLSQSFVRACATQESKVDDAANLVERFKSLFITEEEAGCSVIFEDYAKDSTIWDAEQEDDSGNWTCAPTLFLPETS
ncbi:hypothetical protein K7X08_027680 [Anisodus acutangulus]|uniref:Retrotransposon gag domain-containing protein n=1 Tax=Anisodus acutangulus TaxID=402998 RepID=A0A9Q1LKS5_9SOLA|nr:hypothetical protein K7X08_027680 [Anisodus acutangulus]